MTKTMNPWSTEEEQIVGEIMQVYGADGTIRWTQAFSERPEWKEKLTGNGRSLGAIFAKGNELRKRHGKGNRLDKFVNGTTPKLNRRKGKRGPRGKVAPSADVALVDAEVPMVRTKLKWEVNACPNCTLNVKIMNEAYAAHGIEPPPHCPVCTFPLGIARSAIRIAAKHNGKL